MVKSAFTMIELIFAIVIIAFISAGVPQIISANAKSLEGNLLQDAIFASSDVAAKTLSFQWDVNSLDTTEADAYAKVLDVATTVRVGGLPMRIGHINQDRHRRLHTAVTAPASEHLAIINDTVTTEYGDFIVTTSSGYCNTETTNNFGLPLATGSASTNMKVTEIRATHANLGEVMFRVYAANIGEIDYAKRTF